MEAKTSRFQGLPHKGGFHHRLPGLVLAQELFFQLAALPGLPQPLPAGPGVGKLAVPGIPHRARHRKRGPAQAEDHPSQSTKKAHHERSHLAQTGFKTTKHQDAQLAPKLELPTAVGDRAPKPGQKPPAQNHRGQKTHESPSGALYGFAGKPAPTHPPQGPHKNQGKKPEKPHQHPAHPGPNPPHPVVDLVGARRKPGGVQGVKAHQR
ncbi:hypothetical protein HRbin09_00596 [bacterium HR09]|nr:hypothetical protein HRbin09_00596 [bacterium HR09]